MVMIFKLLRISSTLSKQQLMWQENLPCLSERKKLRCMLNNFFDKFEKITRKKVRRMKDLWFFLKLRPKSKMKNLSKYSKAK
jgi:hypothetical protein